MPKLVLHEGDCLDVLQSIQDASIDTVITDPPYPEIDRDYGRWTEAEWWSLMMGVCKETRRILKPAGSAVFILQPNSRRVGSMRTWLWRFLLWITEEWNQVQDVWWWNCNALSTVHSNRSNGLMRPSMKACVWAGAHDCYRDQASVLWEQSKASKARKFESRALRYSPSTAHLRDGRLHSTATERGGSTPFNVLPLSNAGPKSSHSAGTPMALIDWWIRYICPPGGTVLDPFAGSGTTGFVANALGRDAILIEKQPSYCASIRRVLFLDAVKRSRR